MAELGMAAEAEAERQATSNLAAFLHWLRTVHGLRPMTPDEPMAAWRSWAETDPATAAAHVLEYAGAGFASARLAAGLLLLAELRPDDRILVLGEAPDWLPQALAATAGRAERPGAATVLIAADLPDSLPPAIRRIILTGAGRHAAPPGVTLSHSADWTYPSESSAD